METTEINETDKVQVGMRLEKTLVDAVNEIATAEDRTFTNAVTRLLKTHPRIQPMLETEIAAN